MTSEPDGSGLPRARLERRRSSSAARDAAADDLEAFWIYVVALVPFFLIVFFRGWNATFRTGEAYLYMLGLTVGVAGETVIELRTHGVRSIRGIASDDWGQTASLAAAALAIAAWGAVLIVTQPHIAHATTSWVQVTVFFVGLLALAGLRFSVKAKQTSGAASEPSAASAGNDAATAETSD